ncbi:zingipain-2-like [Mercurialis annua]|uniref:zingipain-2-like n=1 Tax=Mercurialis annua TaxID=3986 RepID=UPI00215FB315|nr:zingipain-2-like [Mercurialis annua]
MKFHSVSATFLLITLLLSYLSAAYSSHDDISKMFETWTKQNAKTYASAEEKLYRLKVFADNFEFVNNHNTQGKSSYTLSLNAFADLTHDEFKASHMGISTASAPLDLLEHRLPFPDIVGQAPSAVDWRAEGAVTEVQNQGDCNSCWVFSGVGAIEGLNKIVNGTLVDLSEQEVVDCNGLAPGCVPGYVANTYKFAIKNHGILPENEYPYEAREMKCQTDKLNRGAGTIDAYSKVPYGNERLLLKVVAIQPVSVAICVKDRVFQLYSQDIFTGPCCLTVDHAVLIVGYGTSKNGVDYWIAKNSWGKQWGMDGYILLKRNVGRKGLCGINMWATFPRKKGFHLRLPTESANYDILNVTAMQTTTKKSY